jgi:prepilin-type processing-associated H-X9-DG protein
MYWDYTIPVYCLRHNMGIGVLGYYLWILPILKLASTVATFENQRPSARATISAVLGVVLFLYNTFTSARAVADCGTTETIRTSQTVYVIEPYLGQAANIYYINVVGAGLAVGAETLMLFWLMALTFRAARYRKRHYETPYTTSLLGRGEAVPESATYTSAKARRSIRYWYCLVILYNFLGAGAFYTGYTNFLYYDGHLLEFVLALIPGPIVLAFLAGMLIRSVREYYNPYKMSSWVAVVCVVLGFHIMAVGIGYVLLGATGNDPWGTALTGGPVGVVEIILGVFVPILGMLLAFVDTNSNS